MKQFLIFLLCSSLYSCGQDGDNSLGGNVSLNSDETIVSSPNSVITSYQIQHLDPSYSELSLMELPYQESLFPVAFANQSIFHEKCNSDYSSRCIINKQVVFKFDLTQFKKSYPSEQWALQEISLNATFTSPYDSNPREKICLLNLKKCNGNVIIPVADDLDDVLFDYIANDNFWVNDISSIIPKNTLLNYLSAILDQSANTWHIPSVTLPISEMLELNEQNHQALHLEDTLYFLVTDDIHVESPKLEIVVKQL